MKKSAVLALITLSTASLAQAGTWTEVSSQVFAGQQDASEAPIDAPNVNYTPVGPGLTQIIGGLYNATDGDLYAITISDAASFSATMLNTVGSRSLSLALLDSTGKGVAAIYDTAVGNNTPTLTSIPGLTNGNYFLLAYNQWKYPADASGNFLFAPQATPNDPGLKFPNPAAGPIGQMALDFSLGFSIPFSGSKYVINLAGVDGLVPTPAAASLLGLAGLGALRRRR